MAVTLRVPTVLRPTVGGAGSIRLEATTVREALMEVDRSHRGFANGILDDRHLLRPFVAVFVNGSDIRSSAQLETTLRDGDEIAIVPSIAGG